MSAPNLDFMREKMAEFCHRVGAPMPDQKQDYGPRHLRRRQVTLGPDFIPEQDIPPTFAHLLGAMAVYEQGEADISKGVWIGSINWLVLRGVWLNDERLGVIKGIFGCREDIVKRGVSSYVEPYSFYPFAEGYSVDFRQESDAEEAFEGRGTPQHTSVGIHLPQQAEPKPFVLTPPKGIEEDKA